MAKQGGRPTSGIKCTCCGKEATSGMVFLCGSRSWIPFCNTCMQQSNRMALAIAATGMSEEALAEAMDVSRSTIRAWRAGKVKQPKPENFERLAALAGVSEDWLAGREDKP
ncbi:MAG: helix-turn-helix transcriptional regulator [Deltaproteobacteria bacterium]|nr:helix-turn-helix transcriptional regulator [Deltaproteobacteria bacterium]